MDELFPTLPAASKPAAVVPKKRGDEGPGRGSGGSYAIQQGRRKKGGGGLSSSQRKKAAKNKKRREAGDWSKLEKVRCLCENQPGARIRARYPEDGRWYDALLNMHVGNLYSCSYTEYSDDGAALLTLEDLNVDEAWLAFEYSTSYVQPRLYGESDDEFEGGEEDDDGFDTAEEEQEEVPAHEPQKAANEKRPPAKAAERKAPAPAPVSAPQSPPPAAPAPAPAPAASAAGTALDTFLAAIGVGDDDELDEIVLEYLQGYIAECVASGEDFETFKEGFRDLLESFVWCGPPPAGWLCAFGFVGVPVCDRECLAVPRRELYGGEAETTDARLEALWGAAS